MHISGVSCEALSSFSREFSAIGNFHRRILEFTQLPEANHDCGSVFRSFANAIKAYLSYYHAQVIDTLKECSTLTSISLYAKFKPKMEQIRQAKTQIGLDINSDRLQIGLNESAGRPNNIQINLLKKILKTLKLSIQVIFSGNRLNC